MWQWICVWDGIWGSEPTRSREEVERRETAFAQSHVLGSLSRPQHAKADELAELREQGKRHLEFACSLAEMHIEQGGRGLFKYPFAASQEPYLWKLRWIDGVRCVRCDQCQFGMISVDSAGNVGLACKAKGFMTNDEYIAEALSRHCLGGHDHIQLLSGRAKSCGEHTCVTCALT